MNWSHFRTFVWLRWRIRVNQVRRAGVLNAILTAVIALAAIVAAVTLFFAMIGVGRYSLEKASPSTVMLVWDGVTGAFLFFWTVGLVTDLQRSEALSLGKFLHLPVSLGGAYVINYLSSLPSVSVVLFLPAMVGLALGMTASRGPAMLLLLPAIAAMMLLVTALTYQFKGWLASLMANPRRRRTVIVVVTTVFVLAAQLPNLLNIRRLGRDKKPDEYFTKAREEQAAWQHDVNAGKMTADEHRRRLERQAAEATARADQKHATIERSAYWLNTIVPPGWLPLGAAGLAEGSYTAVLLGALGMALIGGASLWRGYGTTVRIYRGEFTKGERKPREAAPPVTTGPPKQLLVERQLPLITEPAAAIALAGFRSLLRAPEAKLLLLTPVFMIAIFGGTLLTRKDPLPEWARILTALGGMVLALMGPGQILTNLFGFDRGGFRVFVLSAARRRDILLGKNLSVAPLALGLGLVLLVFAQVLQPMRLDHFVATLPQLVTIYFLYCLGANWLSIFAPMPMAPGSLQPKKPRTVAVLLSLAFLLAMPFLLAPALVAPGAEFLLNWLGYAQGWPVYLLLSPLVCAAAVGLYYVVLGWQGEVLQGREQKILQEVAVKAE